MENKAHFNSMGNDFSVKFGLDDLSGRAKSALFRALLEQSGVLAGLVTGSEAEKVLTAAMTNLWNAK
jgi:hypothetical protein